jgi:hypothetical protein
VPEVAAHADGTPAPEGVLPTDTVTAATDEVVPGDGVRNRTLTLIEREDDTRSWRNFLVYFSLYHNAMPSKGLGIHTYRLLASQEYARC